jgi:ubiquinone/menaquinone biosynthesis C-methylase UbiE
MDRTPRRIRTVARRLTALASGRTLELGADDQLERLPYPEGSFDTVISVLGLARVADATGAVAELRRVLRPGGRLLFAERPRAVAGARDRDTLVLLADAGFALEVRSRAVSGRLRRTPFVVGSARVA